MPIPMIMISVVLAKVVNLRVKVHNFHKSAAGASKVMVDNSFFDAGGIVSEPLPQEKAAVTIQNFYRRRRGDTRLSRNSGIADVVSSVGPAAVGAWLVVSALVSSQILLVRAAMILNQVGSPPITTQPNKHHLSLARPYL